MILRGVSTEQMAEIFKRCSFYKDWLTIMRFPSREAENDFYRENPAMNWIEICFRKAKIISCGCYNDYSNEENEKWVNFCYELNTVYLEKYLTIRDLEYIDKVILRPKLSELADCDGKIELEFD